MPSETSKTAEAKVREAIVDALPSLYRLARSLQRRPDAAEDLVQEAVARALARASSFSGKGSPAAWMRSILYRLALDAHRQSGRETPEAWVEEVEAKWRDDAYTVDPERVAAAVEDEERLADALWRLPFLYRTVVLLHDAEGWTVREIAELLEIGLPAAKQRLRRGRMLLVSALAEEAERRKATEGVPMRCWDAREHVSDYLDGTLDEETKARIEAHLERCPTCPPLVASLVGARQAVGALRDPDSVLPPELAARIRAHLDQHAGTAKA